MPASFPVLKRAMGVAGETGPGPSWGEMMGELWPVIAAPLAADGERLLLDILHHRGQLRLTTTADLPHSLSPEEMLKSLALQALGRWTGLIYLTEMQRLAATTFSSRLQNAVNAVIQKAQAARPQVAETDVISEEEPAVDETGEEMMWSVATYPIPKPPPKLAQRRLVARPVGRLGNLTLISGERARRSRHKEEFEFAG